MACHHLTLLLVGAAVETVARLLGQLPAGDGLLALDQKWLATRLEHQRGDLAAAARSYQALHRSFLDGRLGWEAALVSLDLACLYFELGREELARAVDAKLCEVLVTDRGLHAEAAGALLELLHRARRGELTHELVTEIRGRLLAAGGLSLPRVGRSARSSLDRPRAPLGPRPAEGSRLFRGPPGGPLFPGPAKGGIVDGR